MMRRSSDQADIRNLSEGACTPPDTSKSPPTAYCSSQLKQGTYLIRLKKEENKLEIRHGKNTSPMPDF